MAKTPEELRIEELEDRMARMEKINSERQEELNTDMWFIAIGFAVTILSVVSLKGNVERLRNTRASVEVVHVHRSDSPQ